MTTNNNLRTAVEDLTRIRKEMNSIVSGFFSAGGFEHQLSLLSSVVYEIVSKGSGDDDASLDNEFDYTNRYIRESVYELTELQRFLIALRENYLRYNRCAQFLKQQRLSAAATTLSRKTGE